MKREPNPANLPDRRDFGQFGPVLSWEGTSVLVVMSTDSNDRSSAARMMFDAVADSLNSIGLVDHYPASVEIEIAEDYLTPA